MSLGDPFEAFGISLKTGGADRDKFAPTMDSVEEEDAPNPSFEIDVSIQTSY